VLHSSYFVIGQTVDEENTPSVGYLFQFSLTVSSSLIEKKPAFGSLTMTVSLPHRVKIALKMSEVSEFGIVLALIYSSVR